MFGVLFRGVVGVHYYLQGVAGEFGADLFADFFVNRVSVARVEAYDDIETDGFFVLVEIKAVQLEYIGDVHDDFAHALPRFDCGGVLRVDAVNTHAREDDIIFLIDLNRHLADEFVEVVGAQSVGDFDVNASRVGFGTVVVKHEVIGAAYLGERENGAFYIFGEFGVGALAENLGEGFAQHIDSRFHDDNAD